MVLILGIFLPLHLFISIIASGIRIFLVFCWWYFCALVVTSTFHCFSEIDYAYKLRKCIVPVIIEKDFHSDGWLGEYMKSSKTFDFSKRSMVSGSLDALVQYVTSLSSKKSSPNMDSLSSNSKQFIWVKVFKIGPIKICGSQPLKNVK